MPVVSTLAIQNATVTSGTLLNPRRTTRAARPGAAMVEPAPASVGLSCCCVGCPATAASSPQGSAVVTLQVVGRLHGAPYQRGQPTGLIVRDQLDGHGRDG